jgi:hypothetical protein
MVQRISERRQQPLSMECCYPSTLIRSRKNGSGSIASFQPMCEQYSRICTSVPVFAQKSIPGVTGTGLRTGILSGGCLPAFDLTTFCPQALTSHFERAPCKGQERGS